ncbi:MAG: hypothetical protein HWQ35_09430 [Nostoc sp. NMS1]|nr:hypothetical protein [Nostoc sp. NMS1]MBN3906758.1 hypothetical protein [Nostoc sp. NMS1]
MTSSTIHTDYSEDFGFDFEFDEQVFRPAACIVGCSNYQRVEYGGNLLVCGIYPSLMGWGEFSRVHQSLVTG